MECPCSCFFTKSQDFRYVWTSLKNMNSPRENDDSFDDLNTNLKRPLQSSGLAFNTAFATNASRLCGSSQVKPRRILPIVLFVLSFMIVIIHSKEDSVNWKHLHVNSFQFVFVCDVRAVREAVWTIQGRSFFCNCKNAGLWRKFSSQKVKNTTKRRKLSAAWIV